MAITAKTKMKKLFGTDGIRAKAGEFPLDIATVSMIGASLTRHFTDKIGREPRFVIGRDTRESGAVIESAITGGVLSQGGEVASAGVITTPGVAFLTGRFDFDAGIVISASHNPFEDNGIKVFLPNGKKLDEETESAIEADIAGSIFAAASPKMPANARQAEFLAAYTEYLLEDMKGIDLTGVSLVIDSANGAASEIAPKIFERLGAKVAAIHATPDGRNINENCGSLHLDDLKAKVVELKADLGIAFDGDADRSLFVDETGKIVDGDATLWIMAKEMQDDGRLNGSRVVATVMSNIGLELALRSRNIELTRTAVGDKYVLRELLESGNMIGGEQSGHIILPEKSLVGDGIRTALSLVKAKQMSGKKFSELCEGFTAFPQILVNVKVAEKRPFEEVAAIVEHSRKIETQLEGNGRLLLRYSGTENLARVMIEGKDQAEIEAMANDLAETISKSL